MAVMVRDNWNTCKINYFNKSTDSLIIKFIYIYIYVSQKN